MSHRKGSGKDMYHRKPITAKNIATIQQQHEKEMKIREKSKTVLSGRVKSDLTENSDVVSETDLEYEFLYSVSDDENSEHYSYQFDAYPAAQSPLSTIPRDSFDAGDLVRNQKGGTQKILNREINVSDKNAVKEKQRERVKSATVVDSGKQKSCLSVRRPKSASYAKETKTEMSINENLVCQSKDELVKEVAFRDEDSVVTKSSIWRSKVSAENKSHRYNRRKSVSYDPDLEKASAYIHGGGKNFSRSNTSLTPMKYGMKHLQMNYTETNLETNQSVIFLDLLRSSHQKSQIRRDQIRSIERRLEAKRNNPHYSTTFYDNKNIPDPFHRNTKKTLRSVAQKKIERKEKIKQMSDEIHTGYVPTQLTMKIADRQEIEDIGNKCRYLRCHTPSGL